MILPLLLTALLELQEVTRGHEASTGILRCKLFNARSLKNKLDNLSGLLQSSDFDVIFVTESLLRHDFPDSLLLSNTAYDLFRKDRPDGYGGVAVFVRNTLKVVVLICYLYTVL